MLKVYFEIPNVAGPLQHVNNHLNLILIHEANNEIQKNYNKFQHIQDFHYM